MIQRNKATLRNVKHIAIHLKYIGPFVAHESIRTLLETFVNIDKRESSPNGIDVDRCCQGHSPEQPQIVIANVKVGTSNLVATKSCLKLVECFKYFLADLDKKRPNSNDLELLTKVYVPLLLLCTLYFVNVNI